MTTSDASIAAPIPTRRTVGSAPPRPPLPPSPAAPPVAVPPLPPPPAPPTFPSCDQIPRAIGLGTGGVFGIDVNTSTESTPLSCSPTPAATCSSPSCSSRTSHNAPRSSATIISVLHRGHFPCRPAALVGIFSMLPHCGHNSRATPSSSAIGRTSLSNAAANSAQLPNRSPGCFDSPRYTAWQTESGRSRRNCVNLGTGCVVTSTTTWAVSPRNGRCPTSIS